MHTGPMKDSEGTFDGWKDSEGKCPRCNSAVRYRIWESSCGGYEDAHYKCTNPMCRHEWWVDGPDS